MIKQWTCIIDGSLSFYFFLFNPVSELPYGLPFRHCLVGLALKIFALKGGPL